MRLIILPVFILSFFSLTAFNCKAQSTSMQDSLALVDFYNTTNGPTWFNNSNWLSTATLSSWYGVAVDSGRVTSLEMYSNNLTGSIPPSLGSLSGLRHLGFIDNQLTGIIPTSLDNLSNLNFLGLSNNHLTGNIPLLDNLSNLKVFALSYNKLSGNIPSSLGKLSNLSVIDFSNNQLTGNIPASLGSLFYLSTINLNNNLLSGNIPDSFGNLDSLTTLNFSNNQLSGNIPSSLGNHSALRQLYLQFNQLTDSIPSSIGNLLNLSALDLNNNQLSGNIPSSIGNLLNVQEIYLNNNQLSGNIPSLTGIDSLMTLYLNNNKLTDSIPVSLGSLPLLHALNLSHNQLNGNIPSSLGNLNLLELDLNNNLLTGNIPSSLGNIPFLLYLFLDSNLLSGNIPSSLGNLPDIDTLHLNNNKFTFSGMENFPNYSPIVKYAPQSNIPLNQYGSSLSASAGGNPFNNTFSLYKNDTLLKIQSADSVFTIDGSRGRYVITANNAIASELTLYSDTLTISSDSLILPARPNTEYASYEYTDTAGWTHYYYNNNTPNNLTDDTLLLSLKKNGQNIGTIGDGIFAVKLVATAGAGSNTGTRLTSPLITNASGYWVMNRYWQVTPTHEPAKSVGVRFYYNNQDLKDVNGSYPTHNLTNNKLIFYKAVGGNPDPTTNLAGATKIISILPGTAASDTSWTYHALSDTTQYGEYSVASFSGGGGGGTGNNQALPVVLINFTASLLKNDAQLNWQTSQEVNAGYYTVERSLTGTGFIAIGKVAAAGNSTITNAYKLTDDGAALLNTTALYYRLRITDKDGNLTYSKIIKLYINGSSNALAIYPNPAQNTATLVFTATGVGKYTVEITDIAGKAIKRIEGTSAAGVNLIPANVQGYAKGTYIIKVEGDYVSKQGLKLVKQ